MSPTDNNTKNILILITKGESGGAQTSVFNLAKKLKERGILVTVGFGEGLFLEKKLNEQQIKYIRFNHLKRNHGLLKNIAFVFELRKYIKKNHFSTIHFNSTNTLFGVLSMAFLSPKPKTVFTFRGLSVLDKNYKKTQLVKILYWLVFKVLLSFIDKQVYVSNENLTQAQKMHINKKGVVIYNGLDEKYLEFLDSDEALKKLMDKTNSNFNNKYTIGSIGRLSYQKNYEFLIQNFTIIQKIIPNVVVVLIGAGPNEEIYKKQIAELHLQQKIFLIGEVTEAHRYLKAFNFFILPSRYEGLPIVLIEALFAGIPAIGSNVNGNTEVIGNSGLSFDLDDTIDFENKLKIMMGAEFRKSASREAICRSKLFSIENTIAEYLKIYS